MSPFHNSLVGVNFCCSFGGEQSSGFGIPYNAFDLDTSIAGPSRSQDWYLNPSAEGHLNLEYQERTLLGVLGNQFVDPYTFPPPVPTHDDSNTGESRCF